MTSEGGMAACCVYSNGARDGDTDGARDGARDGANDGARDSTRDGARERAADGSCEVEGGRGGDVASTADVLVDTNADFVDPASRAALFAPSVARGVPAASNKSTGGGFVASDADADSATAGAVGGCAGARFARLSPVGGTRLSSFLRPFGGPILIDDGADACFSS